MNEYFKKYVALRKHNTKVAIKKAKQRKMCYVFLFPYALFFITFVVLPVVTSIYYGFTYYNILEPARFIGLDNYVSLILEDDVFLIGLKITLMIAIITGPLGYIASFLFAWLINELPRWMRTIAVIIFYAPSIAGNCFIIFSQLFRGDAYGHVNALLMEMGIIDAPILWFTNPSTMLWICMIVILWTSLGTGFLSFVAGLQGVDQSQYEAGYMDGVKNRWQELWYITLPSMKSILMFGAVLAITGAFGFGGVVNNLCGNPSTDYCAWTLQHHMADYLNARYEVGYASCISIVLFFLMFGSNLLIKNALGKVGK